MPTVNQLVRKGRKKKERPERTRALNGAPQRRGVAVRVYVEDPKKPNSGNRKLVRVRFPDRSEVTAWIPGEQHNIQEHSVVMIQGGRAKDVPGVRYKVIRGVLDSRAPDRRQGRSRYGVKKEID